MNEPVSPQVIAPVVKSVWVSLSVETAFLLFTDGIARWWPLVTHSVGGVDAFSCHMEGHVGGRIYEVMKDGQESTWGTLLAWEPPQRLQFTFHPGRPADTAQTVEVVFQAEGAGARLTLIHRGWEVLGVAGAGKRAGYETGWDVVLGQFVQRSTQLGRQPDTST